MVKVILVKKDKLVWEKTIRGRRVKLIRKLIDDNYNYELLIYSKLDNDPLISILFPTLEKVDEFLDGDFKNLKL